MVFWFLLVLALSISAGAFLDDRCEENDWVHVDE